MTAPRAGRLAAVPLAALLAAATLLMALQHGTVAGWIGAGFAIPLVLFGAAYAFGVEHRIGFGILAAAAVGALAAGALAGIERAEPCVAVSPFSADRFEPSRISMRTGESRTLTLLDAHGYCRGNPYPGVFGSGGRFSISDRTVASVSQRGVVTAHAPGSAIVRYEGAAPGSRSPAAFSPAAGDTSPPPGPLPPSASRPPPRRTRQRRSARRCVPRPPSPRWGSARTSPRAAR